jgi:hypothetical protein
MTQETPNQKFSVEDYHEDVEDIESFIRLSLVGLKYSVEHIGEIIRVDETLRKDLYPPLGINLPPTQNRSRFQSPIADDKRIVKFAKSQYPDAPYLVGIAVIRLWSILEVAADELALHLLKTLPKVRQNDAVRKLKGSLIDFVNLSPEDQAQQLLKQLKDDLKANLKAGITHFEDVFNALGVGDSVEPTVKNTLFELSEVRNVLTHRTGIVDSRLVNNCPQLKVKLGDKLILANHHLYAYVGAASWYINELYCRQVKAESGQDICNAEDNAATQAYLVSLIQSYTSQYPT